MKEDGRTEIVQKVLEGLREEAVELARDIGIDVLTQPGGLRKFVDNSVTLFFPVLMKKPVSSLRLDNSQVPSTPKPRVYAVVRF